MPDLFSCLLCDVCTFNVAIYTSCSWCIISISSHISFLFKKKLFLDMSLTCICSKLSTSEATKSKKKILCYETNFLKVRIISDESSTIWIFVKEKNVKQYKFSTNVKCMTLVSRNGIITEDKNEPKLIFGLITGEIYKTCLPDWKELVKLYREKSVERVFESHMDLIRKLPGEVINHIICIDDNIITTSSFEEKHRLCMFRIDDNDLNEIHGNDKFKQSMDLDFSAELRNLYVCCLQNESTNLYSSINNILRLEEFEYSSFFGEENVILISPVLCFVLKKEVLYLSLKSYCYGTKINKLCGLQGDCEAVGIVSFPTSFLQDNADVRDVNFSDLQYTALVHFGSKSYCAIITNNFYTVCIDFQYNSVVLAKVAMSKNLLTMSQAFAITMQFSDIAKVVTLCPFVGENNLHPLPENDMWVFDGNALKCFSIGSVNEQDSSKNEENLVMILGDLERLDLQEKELNLKSKSLDFYIHFLSQLRNYLQKNAFENKAIFSQTVQENSLFSIETQLEYDANDKTFYLKTNISCSKHFEILQDFKFNFLMQIFVAATGEIESIPIANKFGIFITKLPQCANLISYTVTYFLHLSSISLRNDQNINHKCLNLTLPILKQNFNLLDCCKFNFNDIKQTEDLISIKILFGDLFLNYLKECKMPTKSLLEYVFCGNIKFEKNSCNLLFGCNNVIINIPSDNCVYLQSDDNFIVYNAVRELIEKFILLVEKSNDVILNNLKQLLSTCTHDTKNVTKCHTILIK